MKDNYYLFIIWNKALFCKDRIIKDLESSFEIIHSSYIEWSKDKFIDNLEALYGRKLGNPKDKIIPCGIGKFYVLIVRDNNPKFEERKQYDGYEIVNSNIYDKKALYRKWTAGSHRVHCSVDESEFNHDIAVLFGEKYIENSLLNTKGVRGFDSINDFETCVKMFSNPSIIKTDNRYFIFTKCRHDLVSYLKCIETSKNIYSLNIDNHEVKLVIFGIVDKDIDRNLSEDNINIIINDYENYIKSIDSINPSRISDKHSLLSIIIPELKLIRAKIKYH